LALLYSFNSIGQISCDRLIYSIQIQPDSVQPESFFPDQHKKIGRIEHSESSFEIRYYYSPSLTNGGSVTIINCANGILTAKKINYWFNPKKAFEKRRVNKIETAVLRPTDSWESFIDSLTNMNFFNFPTMEEVRPKMIKYMQLEDGRTVEKRSMITDGADYTYQVKLNDKIRTFSYHSPMAWFKVYDHVDELKMAEDIKNHFINNLIK